VREDGGVTDDASGYPGAPPGWYADPAGGPGQRWWDGYAWTAATVGPAIPPPLPPSVPPAQQQPPSQANRLLPPPPTAYPQWMPRPPDAPDLVHREVTMTQTARVAVAFFGVNDLITLLNLQLRRSQIRAMGHNLRVIYDASRNGRPVPALSGQSTASPLSVVFSLAAIAALVFALIWQFRAASAARALGFGATHSPGWGVGCWFVPIVNLWMPYQAIRDCLPPDDPHRPLVLRWWLIVLGTQLLTYAAFMAALFSSHVALGISLPAAILAVGVIATSQQVVVAISTAHQTALTAPRGM
jgi:hypothetical protein